MITEGEMRARVLKLARTPTETRESLVKLQEMRLMELVRHAQSNVPFYEQRLAERGLAPGAFSGISDLQLLPILTREELQTFGRTSLLTRGIRPEGLASMRSSGSTGRPIVVFQTSLERWIYLQFRSRTFSLLGPEISGKKTYVGMDSRTEEQKRTPLAERLTIVEARQDTDTIWREVVASAPDVLISYPSVFAELLRAIPPGALRKLGVRLIVASGEVLEPTVERQLISAFSARVTATYASSEFFWMGGRCDETRQYHVVDDSILLEVVDDAGSPVKPGEEGDVVGTALHSFAQPLIRYRIGDRAIAGDAPALGAVGCRCGAPFSTISSVLGRSLDFLALPDGRRVHAYVLSIPLREQADFMDQYQIVQDSFTKIRILFSQNRSPEGAEKAALLERLSKFVPGVTLVLESTAHLPRQANGKFRAVHSHIEP